MRSYAIYICLCLAGTVGAFTMPQNSIVGNVAASKMSVFELNIDPKDPSRSGTKRGRMDKLAEMEELGSASGGDNSVFVKAAGGFVAFIVIAIAAAASSGLLTQY